MWFLRKMIETLWTDNVTNERVLKMANVKCKLLSTIKNRGMTFLGHVIHRSGLENLSLTGKIEGKRKKRQAEINEFKQHQRMDKHGK